MKFCCATSEAPGQVAENRGFPVFETRRDLRKANIALCEMCIALLDFAPKANLMVVRDAMFSVDH